MKRMLDRVLKNSDPSKKNEYQISFNKPSLEFELASGEKYQGTFRIIADDKGKPEGYAYSEDLRMTILSPEFGGLNKEIGFVFDATGLKEGVTVTGVISVVSNLGEYELPYKALITSTILDSEFGEIRNLFHFANVAKTDFTQAVKIFYSPIFEKILSGNDSVYMNYYRGLSVMREEDDAYPSGYNESNVDVFLELIKKKNRTRFLVDRKEIVVKNPSMSTVEEIRIKRDGWGYTRLEIAADCDFVYFDNDNIIEEDFVDGIATIPVYINMNELHRGKNTGTIYISNFYQTIEISVVVITKDADFRRDYSSLRRDNMHVMKLYTDFRLGRISKAEWIRECSVTVTRMLGEKPEDITSLLYRAHLLIQQKREADARKTLEIIKELIYEETPYELIGYSLYLEFLLAKDERLKAVYAEKIELLYVQDTTNYRLAWLMMNTKEDYKANDKERWRLMKRLYEYGCNSPVIFIETLSIMVNSPGLMISLEDFELAFFTFAMRHDAMTGELRNRLSYLAAKEVTFSYELYELLSYCYDRNPNDETLVQICTLLMKGNLFGQDYFKWYERAVENELRINKLYEYYIMSIDMNYNGRLPKIVLMYFAYRSNLDFERNAFLYANVLKHKPAYQEIYNDYLPVIEEFAKTCLLAHRINDNLAFIYRTVLGDNLLSAEYVRSYAYLCFVYSITVNNDFIDSVIVINENLIDEQQYPIYNGHALIPIVGDNYSILLEDSFGNRYADPSLFEIRRIINGEPNIDKIMQLTGAELYATLYIAEKCEEQSALPRECEDALLYITQCDAVSDDFRLRIMINLAKDYFDRDDIAKLDELLLRFDPSTLDGKMRETCIRIMVARGMYDRALDWVRTYGTEYVDDKILVRLCDRVLMRSDYEYEPELLKICQGIFNDNRYDETILKYLILYMTGTSMGMKRVWRAADSFNVDTHTLLEKLIIQLMYTGVVIGEESAVFLEYIAEGGMPEVETAFLNKLSYDYFALNRKVDSDIFDRVIFLHQQGENVSDYCKIAFLKNCDSLTKAKKMLSSEQKALVVLFVKEFISRHMLFPFFLGFKNLWPKLSLYDDRCFIEYRGTENARVMLHYTIEAPGMDHAEYNKEEMVHYLGGVYVMSFILFHGEKIKYYITEEGSRSEKLTRSDVLEAKDTSKQDNDTRYAMINNIALMRSKGDDEAFCRLSEEYVKKSYIVDRLFLPDRGEL